MHYHQQYNNNVYFDQEYNHRRNIINSKTAKCTAIKSTTVREMSSTVQPQVYDHQQYYQKCTVKKYNIRVSAAINGN